MVPNEVGSQLHDRATRNLPLSEEERGQLQQWYQEQDELEMRLLGLSDRPKELKQLRGQVETALVQLQVSTQRLRELSEENQALRREVDELRRQVAQLLSAQPV